MKQEKSNELENIINKDYNNIVGVVVYKAGEKLYENYFNDFIANQPIHIFSVTKSIISVLIGIAIDEGYIKNINQNVLDFFPEYIVKRGEKTIQNVTLKNLLTMTAPYKYKSAPYTKYFTSNNWVKASLDLLGGKGQIGDFRYAPLIGPDILSGIITNVTGKNVLDFARDHLFTPLGITVKKKIIFKNKEEQLAFYKAKNISAWVSDPSGVNTAGWGLTLTAMDMAKIGQLYLDDGIWNKKRIVSKEWIDESTKCHSVWEKFDLKYGYLWWIIDNKKPIYAAMGDGGNVIYVNTNKKLVVSIASYFKPTAKDRLNFIKEHIETIF